MKIELAVGEINLLITTLQQGTQIFVWCKNEAARHRDSDVKINQIYNCNYLASVDDRKM